MFRTTPVGGLTVAFVSDERISIEDQFRATLSFDEQKSVEGWMRGIWNERGQCEYWVLEQFGYLKQEVSYK